MALQMWKSRLKPEDLAYIEFCEQYQHTYDQSIIKVLSDLLSDEESRAFGPGTMLNDKTKPMTIKIGG